MLEPYLTRVVHALNHLVQPAEGTEKAAAAARGVGGGAGGGSRSTSGSRSRSRSSRGFGGHGGGGGGRGSGGLSPMRSAAAAASLSDPRARVRLQALTLLESMAAKDAKGLYPHWVLFFAPNVPGVANGGGGGGGGDGGGSDAAAAAMGVQSGGSNPVLPAGLLSILEDDDAPQVRAAAAGAAASLVKNAPLRKWMLLLPPPTPSSGAGTASAGGGVGGIGERVESMMLRFHRSLVGCLAREKVATICPEKRLTYKLLSYRECVACVPHFHCACDSRVRRTCVCIVLGAEPKSLSSDCQGFVWAPHTADADRIIDHTRCVVCFTSRQRQRLP